MPALCLSLDPATLAQLDHEIARGPGRCGARFNRSALVAHLVRRALQDLRRARAAALRELLRVHPLRPGAGLPHPLQDQALALIAAGQKQLIPELVRAGEWENQIAALARRWAQDGLSHQELCAAGMVGLLRAIQDWRPGPGWRSYAYLWIKKELERACRTGGALVMESEHEMRLRRTVERHARRGLDPAAIARKTGLSLEQVERGAAGRRALDWKEIDPRRM